MAGHAARIRVASILLYAALPAAAQQQEDEPVAHEARLEREPKHSVELAVSDDAVWAAYLGRFDRGRGFYSAGFLGDDDEDFLGNLQLMRFGLPSTDLPLELGVGLGFYAGFVDQPDAEVYALTIGGAARYTFPTAFPTSVGGTLHYASDATTFDDGEQLIDLVVRGEVEISSFATAFLGYRFLQAELKGGAEPEFDQGLHVGVRIGL